MEVVGVTITIPENNTCLVGAGWKFAVLWQPQFPSVSLTQGPTGQRRPATGGMNRGATQGNGLSEPANVWMRFVRCRGLLGLLGC